MSIEQARPLMLRLAEEHDLADVARIHIDGLRAAYRGMIADSILDGVTFQGRLESWSKWYRSAGYFLFVAGDGEHLRGFCRLGPARAVDDPPSLHCEITHLYVAPEVIGDGYGHALLSHAIEAAIRESYEELILWVLEKNARARRFYEAHGLRFDGARRDEPDRLGEGVFEVRYRLALGDRAPDPRTPA